MMGGMARTLYIIDGHAHIYAAYYAPMRPLTSPRGEPTKATYVVTTAILGLIERNKPDMLVVAMDSKTPSFRSRMYPEYKAHRPPMPDDMPQQIARIEEILGALRIPVLRVDGYEADDVIGTLTSLASKAGITSYICSKDKDMLQLLDERTCMYDMKTGQTTTVESLQSEMGLAPGQFIDVLALQGDSVDNVPGVPDVGPKTAIQWIQQYGSVDNLFAHADEIGGKRGESLRSSRELVALSRRLVVIDRDAPVTIDEASFAVKAPDRERLAALFAELDFSRLLTQMGLSKEAQAAEAVSAAVTAEAAQAKPDAAAGREYHLLDTDDKFDRFVAELKKQKLFALDTETTSTDPMRADLVGLSFAWQAGRAFYIPVRGPLGQKHVELEQVHAKLVPILADAKVRKVGQNVKYDCTVLANAGMPVAGVYFDTMVASYVLDADRQSHSLDAMVKDFLGLDTIPISRLIGKGKGQLTFDMVDTSAACEYSAEDADMTWRVHEYLSPRLDAEPKLKKLFEEVEMPLVLVLARIEQNGVSLDVPLLKNLSHAVTEELDRTRDRIHAVAGFPFNIDSTRQLAEVLFDRLGLPSLRQGKTQRSTDAAVLEELADQHEIVPLILQYRQLGKLKNTYLDKLGELINPRTGRVHASFNQTVTATGRLSSSDPNLQNIPVRTELGKKIRAAFVPAKKGDCILSADYSQIELRLLAHFSGDAALRKAFAEDQDIHRFVASQVFGVPLQDVSSEMRSRAKAVNFGIIYGQGAFGLSKTVGISQAEAKRFIDDYFARYGSIRTFMDGAIAQAKKAGYAETILGRRRPIVGLGGKDHNKRELARRLTINTIIQGSAADLIKVAMINIQRRIDREGLPIRMILQIHDELVFELPHTGAAEHGRWIADEMTGAIRLDVPMKVDVTIGRNWLGEK